MLFSRAGFQPICHSTAWCTLKATFCQLCSPAAVSCKVCPVPEQEEKRHAGFSCFWKQHHGRLSKFLLTDTEGKQVISEDWLYNVTLPVWHKTLDCGYFYHPYVVAGVLIAKVFLCMLMNKAFLLSSWLLGVRLLSHCNRRIDAPSRVPAPKCFCSRSTQRSYTHLSRNLEICFSNNVFSNSSSVKALFQSHRSYWYVFCLFVF